MPINVFSLEYSWDAYIFTCFAYEHTSTDTHTHTHTNTWILSVVSAFSIAAIVIGNVYSMTKSVNCRWKMWGHEIAQFTLISIYIIKYLTIQKLKCTHLHASPPHTHWIFKVNTNLYLQKYDKQLCRQLILGYLPNITHLNGTRVDVGEREDAERAFIRHYMGQNERPSRLLDVKWPDLCCTVLMLHYWCFVIAIFSVYFFSQSVCHVITEIDLLYFTQCFLNIIFSPGSVINYRF